MSESRIKINIATWVKKVEKDKATLLRRRATDIILHAIASNSELNELLFLKGGILMGLAYGSLRQTTDIDFTVSKIKPDENTANQFKCLLDAELSRAAIRIGYPQIVIKTQSIRGMPIKKYPNARFPALKITVAFAYRGSTQEKRLNEGQAASTISLDLTFNEVTTAIQILEIRAGVQLHAYSLTEIIAEKYRALLQQEYRKRFRPQDVFDLNYLIQNQELKDETNYIILNTMMQKCESRGINPQPSSIDSPDLRKRAQSEWNTLELEIGNPPNFDVCFERIVDFYKQLPWQNHS